MRLEQAFGLDRPMPVQYLSWLGKFLTLDWGYSFSSHQPVLQLIGERLPNTIYLMGTVFVVVLLFAIPIGVMTALKQYSIFDHVVTGATFAFLSLPTFWLGLLLIILFGLQLHWLPLGGMATPGAEFDVGDRARHLILPVATLALVQVGITCALPAGVDARDDRSGVHAYRACEGPRRARRGAAARTEERGDPTRDGHRARPAGALRRRARDRAVRMAGHGPSVWEPRHAPITRCCRASSRSRAPSSCMANLLADVMYGYLDPRIRFS